MLTGRDKEDLLQAYKDIDILLAEIREHKTALEKTVGLLTNIRHETDYMPDFYYEWIDKVINEVDDLLPVYEYEQNANNDEINL